MSSQESGSSTATSCGSQNHNGLDFKLVIDSPNTPGQTILHFICPSMQEKQAWFIDISQVTETLHKKESNENISTYFHNYQNVKKKVNLLSNT